MFYFWPQNYGDYSWAQWVFAFFVLSCCDREPISRQTNDKPSECVAKTPSNAGWSSNFSCIYPLGIHDLQPESDWSSIRLYVNFKKTILSYQIDYTFSSKRLYFLIKKTILSHQKDYTFSSKRLYFLFILPHLTEHHNYFKKEKAKSAFTTSQLHKPLFINNLYMKATFTHLHIKSLCTREGMWRPPSHATS
jgi:hypothetical protein